MAVLADHEEAGPAPGVVHDGHHVDPVGCFEHVEVAFPPVGRGPARPVEVEHAAAGEEFAGAFGPAEACVHGDPQCSTTARDLDRRPPPGADYQHDLLLICPDGGAGDGNHSAEVLPRAGRGPRVRTRHRRIVTKLPVPESLPLFERMERYEPASMQGQPPVMIHRAKGWYVEDRWGNRWLDWSTGVLISNAGNGNPAIVAALRRAIRRPLLSTYVFPHTDRAMLVEELAALAPTRAQLRLAGVPPLHGVGGLRELHQAREDLGTRAARTRPPRLRLVQERLPRPHHGGAARRGHGRGQALAGPAGRQLRAGPLPRRVQEPGHPLRALPRDPRREGRAARAGLRRHGGELPGRGPRLPARRVREAARGVVPEARRGAHHGRGAGRLRPHRRVVHLRALRHRPGSHRLRQGHLLLAAPVGGHRPGRHHGAVPPGLDDLDPLGFAPARCRGARQRAGAAPRAVPRQRESPRPRAGGRPARDPAAAPRAGRDACTPRGSWRASRS